jgi:hypothetical protein
MYIRAWEFNKWSPPAWLSIGGKFLSEPAVVTWGADRLDVFGIGMDGAMYHKAFAGNAWFDWESLGGKFTSLPAAVASAVPGHSIDDVFGIGMDGAMYSKFFQGGLGWLPRERWALQGGKFLSPPVVVNSGRGSNREDIFGIGMDGAMYHQVYGTTPWEPLGGKFMSSPAAVTGGPNRLDVFGIGMDSAMYYRSFRSNGWTVWESLGGSFLNIH